MNVKELKEKLKLKGAAIIDRSGIIEDDALPDTVNRELFSVMCATVYGAANTINSGVLKNNTKNIKVESNDDNILISPYNDRHFVVVIASKTSNIDNFDLKTLLSDKHD
ncbi:MAG: hypothetical protein QXT62_00990 [Thermoplasmata archaeon]